MMIQRYVLWRATFFVLCMLAGNVHAQAEVRSDDVATFFENTVTIGKNVCAMCKNCVCLSVRAVVDGSSALAKLTKFFADHPACMVATGVGACYLCFKIREWWQLYQWRLRRTVVAENEHFVNSRQWRAP